MLDAHSLIAMFWVAAFGCGMLLFWFGVRTATTGVQKYQDQFSNRARNTLEQMFLFIDAKQLWTLNAVLIGGMGIVGWLMSNSLFVVGGLCVIGYFLPRLLFAFFQMRRLRALRNQMPDSIMLIAGGLRAGASLPGALTQMVSEMPPPISQEFDLFLREQRIGVSFDDALDSFEKRVPVEELALLSSALRVSRETGGNLAETLERLAATLREKLTIEGKIRALTAQGKLQGIVVGMLPLALMAVLFHMEPEAMWPLFHEWYGWATLGFIFVMEFIGAIIIRKIVSIDV
jgi:tight adherence protein B